MTKYEKIKKTLEEIYKLDQTGRLNMSFEEMEKIQGKNFEKVEKILENDLDLLLEKATKKDIFTIWLVIQHGDLKDQKKYLDLIKKFVQKKLLDSSEYAKTIDRILLNKKKPQIYGTQVIKVGDKYQLYKLEDKDNINEIRKEIGLEPLEEYFKRAPFEVEF